MMPLLISLLDNPFCVCIVVFGPYLVGLPWVGLERASCTFFSPKSSPIFQELFSSSFTHERTRGLFLSLLYFLFLILLLPSRYALFSLYSHRKKKHTAHTEWEKISSFFHCHTQHLLDGFSFFLFFLVWKIRVLYNFRLPRETHKFHVTRKIIKARLCTGFRCCPALCSFSGGEAHARVRREEPNKTTHTILADFLLFSLCFFFYSLITHSTAFNFSMGATQRRREENVPFFTRERERD